MTETDGSREPPLVSGRYDRQNSGAHKTLKMLKLPPRGDALARRWFFAGVVFYLVMSGVLVGTLVFTAAPGARWASVESLIGIGQHVNPALTLLVLAGIGLTIAASVKVWTDIRDMQTEEVDVEWVRITQREGLPLIFADPAKRMHLFKNQNVRSIPETDVAVETLLDDRVRRIHMAAATGGAAVATTEMQSVAVIRTAVYGSFARYASSLLLLLAVLGTFAGVKTALPSLIDALGEANLSTSSLTIPLNAVAGAFGGNALALIGAIAVGLMAQGIGFGRRNLLERIELVSAEYIYGEGTTVDANPLQGAVSALRDTAIQIHAATGMMGGIESGLQGLGSEFRASFNALADRLHDLATRQEEGLYDKTAAALMVLQERVADAAKVIEANGLAHATLVSSLQERSQESRAAIEHMTIANDRLGSALDAFIKVGEGADKSFAELREASHLLTAGSQGVAEQVTSLTRAVEQVRPGMDSLGKEITEVSERIRRTGDESRAAWQAVSEEIARKLRDPARVSSTPVPVARGDTNHETLALLQRIANASETAGQRPSFAAAMLPSLSGALIGGGIVYAALRFLTR